MDQERVTLVPPGGIERTARSIEYLGSTKGMEKYVSKIGTIHYQNGTIDCQEEQYKTKLKRNKPILLQRECREEF